MAASTATTFTIPETMKRLVVTSFGATVKESKIEIQTDVPVPKPASDEILIKMVAAAVNPSDYGKWKGSNNNSDEPLAMGLEGSGIVVATGGGLMTKRVKIGDKVAVVGPTKKQGTYSEYIVMAATEGIFSLGDKIPVEDAASYFVNPFTAIAILDTAKNAGAKALVHTAAASQLGQMMVKLTKSEGANAMKIINVVRREEQATLLKELGAEHVVVTSEDNWKETLKAKVEELQATVAFDAVAGEQAGDILTALPKKGTLFIYGALGGTVSGIDPIQLIYQEKQVKGFLLTPWVKAGGLLMSVPRMVVAGRKVNAGLLTNGGWSSSQFKDTTMEKLQSDVVELLENKATGQKMRLRMDVV
ncbi:Enoyl-[acyl-carrier-protein] reductase, mitochondrial [Seminavis robusta]|uniref:Enoyl-[acyl-carrier-protein] reductase, mitochondrial n=1 Tax=Seminavis robusta TaxID=568900 RepID=A0A9N8HJ75_9STRA|nr:Enoyl-[acyl-carrier-protein] reductase, mitochondrial [Seminavis robusta]|eukprot:Sro673_g185190.1 Enoyl-[acyl-carrier-protein] reductase, mitochondrial (360) ;mRNA; f:14831-15910